MSTRERITFKENSAIKGRETAFIDVQVDVAKVLASWKDSVFSHEWLDGEGAIKTPDEMAAAPRAKREALEQVVQKGEAITKAVLGIGIMDNIEIGSARAEFLTLAALGHKTLPVHIPAADKKDFQKVMVKDDD